LKSRLDILFQAPTINLLCHKLVLNKPVYESFKVSYLKQSEDQESYHQILSYIKDIASNIKGNGVMRDFKVEFGLIYLNKIWYLGLLKRNDNKWHTHDQKPHSFSNALSIRYSKALVNIAAKQSMTTKIIDPCCGIGSVVLEGLSMNLDIRGSDISAKNTVKAQANLKYFGYNQDKIIQGDIHDITEYYDVAIIDLPYGLYAYTTIELQEGIINKATLLAQEVILITHQAMNDYLSANYLIIKEATIYKASFKRYIYIIKRKIQN
ncbi:MAG: TRM11 family SAM-dependent methyltransferase, partial [Bacilli bacterium]